MQVAPSLPVEVRASKASALSGPVRTTANFVPRPEPKMRAPGTEVGRTALDADRAGAEADRAGAEVRAREPEAGPRSREPGTPGPGTDPTDPAAEPSASEVDPRRPEPVADRPGQRRSRRKPALPMPPSPPARHRTRPQRLQRQPRGPVLPQTGHLASFQPAQFPLVPAEQVRGKAELAAHESQSPTWVSHSPLPSVGRW